MAEVNRNLNTQEETAFNRLLTTVRTKSRRNSLRLEYFDMKRKLDKIGFSVPPHMTDFQTTLGWPAKAVRVPARRIKPEGFTLSGSSSLLSEIDELLEDNQIASLERMVIESSLLHSVAFMFASPGDESLGEPEVIASGRTALEATAEIDARTRRVTSALEIVSKKVMLLYLPGLTLRLEASRGRWSVTNEYEGVAGRVTCTPYVWGRSLQRQMGYSRINTAVMGHTDRAIRSMLRQEVNAEFFSAPRMALYGADGGHFVDAEGNRISPLSAMMGSVWGLPDVRDEETDELKRVQLEQFAQASFTPHAEMQREIAANFAGETDIPVSQLGIIHDNPASAEAILAAESGLLALVEGELPVIADARIDFAKNVLAVRYGEMSESMVRDLRGLRAHFGNPATPTRAAMADAGQKFVATFPWLADSNLALELFGLNAGEVELAQDHRLRADSGGLLEALTAATAAGDGTSDETDLDAELKRAQILTANANSLGTLRRAGVDAVSASAQVGLVGLKFIEGDPITIKTREERQ